MKEKDGLVICLPTRGSITFETHLALTENLPSVPNVACCVARKPVDEARNILAKMAIEVAAQLPAECEPFVLWVDDDAWWPRGTVERMLDVLRTHPGLDILAACAGVCLPFKTPTGLSDGEDSLSFLLPSDADADGLCEAECVGFHFVLHRLAVLASVGEAPFSIVGGPAAAEDAAFDAG